MKTCYIFGAVATEKIPENPGNGDLIIAADAGLLNARALGIEPDLAVGDFDSLGQIPVGIEIIRHPVIKDDTDTVLAVRLGLEKGFKRFVIYGALGGKRLDQTLASLQTLTLLTENGATGYLCGEGLCVTAVKNGLLRFRSGMTGTVSVFSLGESSFGVNLKGLFYRLDNATVKADYPIGVSNEFTEEDAEIEVKNGLLTVLWNGSPLDISEEK